MIRFEYKVLKSFLIYRDLKGKRQVARTDEEKKSGTSFGLTSRYVDYESKENEIEQDPFTSRLCKLQYLKLDRQIKMRK